MLYGKQFRSALAYYLPALIVVAAVFVSIVYADTQKRVVHQETARADVATRLGLIRSRLENDINADIQLVKGIVATLKTEPDIGNAAFNALTRNILEGAPSLRGVAAARLLNPIHAFPPTAAESAIANGYLSPGSPLRSAAEQARDTGQIVVTGPQKLNDGSRGIIVQYPVFNEAGRPGGNFWGIVTATIDLDRLYDGGRLSPPGSAIDVAIAARGKDGAFDQPFFGKADVPQRDAVRMLATIADQNWMLYAVPQSGWTQTPSDIWFFRCLMTAVGALIMAPVLWVASLLRERQANIGVLRQREEELRALSHRLEIALEASKIGVWEMDVSSGSLFWDGRMKTLYGIGKNSGEACYDIWRSCLHPDDLQVAERNFAEAIRNNRDYSTDFRIVCANGEVRHIRAFGTVYRDSRFRKKIVGVNWNVTEDVRLQEELREAKRQAEVHNQELERARQHMEYNSLHDALTDLPNRRYLDQYLKQLDAQPLRRNGYALLHIDLDRFKEINDTLGHGAGDAILRHTAAKLRDNIRRGDFVARIGGDEFVVVCNTTVTDIEHRELARRLIEALNSSIVYDGQDCRVGASIGIATRRSDEETAEYLLINADIALYEAKRQGRNRVEHYTDSIKSEALATKQTGDAILRSLECNDFVAYYQPQFDARTLEICGVEALARWDHPERGLENPSAFMKIAEDLNVMAQIDAAILDQALFQATRWEAQGLEIPRVSVNISTQRLFDETLLERIGSLKLPKGKVSFELLESISFDDRDEVTASIIARLKDHGIDIEIDDFGTGYASILSLLKLAPRRLKIDRQLIRPVVHSPSQRRLISSIIDIGRSLSIEIVAEGVETMQHAHILSDLGCQVLQGYALARPMAANDFIGFAKRRQWFPTGEESFAG
ncbi:bifunctional diguanylate cyclase/phosphodiesterase [Rhizobium halophytocola]|uniref:Diguanylate cyclase (GGDEF)-like protein/PAS domain S-box-containing protein n=1 Tax=Rhizobium halophytocola TaxID=735519 RepID=A0ABS4DSK0_9HYPH|nr:EAL domain-containing protein [Rhizobium halophytocola]MBP1848664.1 diguanylate cyclase (GGDEF)-like protein/PAS domain S-box-containing protein [Rhizobium halophytocola]